MLVVAGDSDKGDVSIGVRGMEQNNKKILTVSFLCVAVVMALVLDVLMETLASAWGPFAKLYAVEAFKHGSRAGVGLITFVALQFNPRVLAWGDEVILELTKVVWPTKKETTQGTIVTFVMLVISGLVLGFFDFSSTQIVKMIISGDLF